ncbi:MAG: hypothetical protein ACOVOV_01705, partial [Dolichospermum sp.]
QKTEQWSRCTYSSCISVENAHIKSRPYQFSDGYPIGLFRHQQPLSCNHLQGCTTKANKPITDNFNKVYKN